MDGQTWACEMQKSWELPTSDADVVAEAINEQLERNYSFDITDDLAELRAILVDAWADAEVVSGIISDSLTRAIHKLDDISCRFEAVLSDRYEAGYDNGKTDATCMEAQEVADVRA